MILVAIQTRIRPRLTHLGVIGVLGFCNSQPAMPISQSVGVPRSELVVLEPLLVPQVVCHDLVEHCGVERIGIAAFVGEALRDVRVAGLVDALGRLRARARLDEAVHADVRVGIVPRPLRQTAKAQAINKNFLCSFLYKNIYIPVRHTGACERRPSPPSTSNISGGGRGFWQRFRASWWRWRSCISHIRRAP
jgi:hypothetical protein